MWKILTAILGDTSGDPAKKAESRQDPVSYVTRLGKTAPADEAWLAWMSADLDRMLGALNTRTNPIDRHFLLMAIVERTYKQRSDPQMAQTCARVAELHLAEFPQIAPALQKEFDGNLPHVGTFQRYATLLTEHGEFEKAINVCRIALSFGLKDDTLSGFEGRIERIRKKQPRTLPD
ncbi:MAG: hypothetical protein NTW68_11780 [candidate division NC10 bacterium]|nr:hypothetical protein [candidate division NC10 bacterium]